jgi:hypothetical protein
MLAHEAAHLRRRDPAVRLLLRALSCATFFQPLQRAVLRRLEHLAEVRCDAAAVAATGDGIALARGLLRVAQWLSAKSPASLAHGVGMAAPASELARRIRRICGPSGERPARARRLPAAACAAAAIACSACLHVDVRLDDAPAAEAPPAASAAALPDASPPPAAPPAAPAPAPTASQKLVVLGEELKALIREIDELSALVRELGDASLSRALEGVSIRAKQLESKRVRLLERARKQEQSARIARSSPDEN